MAAPSTTDMRRQLLEAALGILQADGAVGLTVRNITEQAGCSTTGIYTHFGDKHGLVEAIYLEGFQSLDEALADDYDNDDLLAAGLTYRSWALANPMHYLVMFGRAVPDFEAGPDAHHRAVQSFELLAAAMGRYGADDPLRAAYHLMATVHGYVMLELNGMMPAPADRIEAFYENGVRAVLQGLGLA